MARSSTNGSTFKSFNNHNQIKKESSLNIDHSNACMRCGNPFTKGHLNVCPAKDIICKNCYSKGYFAKLCKFRNKRPTVNTVNDNYVKTENCTYVSPESSWGENQESCDVINTWNECGQSDDDDFSVISVKTIYDENGLGTKKLLNRGLGWEMIEGRWSEFSSRISKPCKLFKAKRVAQAQIKIPETENPPKREEK